MCLTGITRGCGTSGEVPDEGVMRPGPAGLTFVLVWTLSRLRRGDRGLFSVVFMDLSTLPCVEKLSGRPVAPPFR